MFDHAFLGKCVERVGIAVNAAVISFAGARCWREHRRIYMPGREEIGGPFTTSRATRVGVTIGIVIPIDHVMICI